MIKIWCLSSFMAVSTRMRHPASKVRGAFVIVRRHYGVDPWTVVGHLGVDAILALPATAFSERRYSVNKPAGKKPNEVHLDIGIETYH